jgi:hypothetical protein
MGLSRVDVFDAIRRDAARGDVEAPFPTLFAAGLSLGVPPRRRCRACAVRNYLARQDRECPVVTVARRLNG